MNLTTDDLFKIHALLSEKDVQIALLQREVHRLSEENRQLRARQTETCAERENAPKGFVVLSVDRLCRLLSGLNVHLSSFLCTALQKALPPETSVETVKQLVDAAKMDEKPQIQLTAEGDMKVDKLVNHGTVISTEQIDTLHMD